MSRSNRFLGASPFAQQRMLLPIYKHRKQILHAIENCGVVVIVGETACGKSTQLPQFFFENGWCDEGYQILVTQPRRIAAQTLAQRVAQEVAQGPLGTVVGYSVRFDDKSSPDTKIKFLTDGVLLREATLYDPLLSKYSIVVVDEAHERNINSDVLLGLLKKVRRKRPDLRVVICSATIDAEAFLDFFVPSTAVVQQRKRKRVRRWDNPNAKIQEAKEMASDVSDKGTIISVDGRQHSVSVLYLDQPTSDYIRSCVETAFHIFQDKGTSGDILCFLPSSEDVDTAIRLAEQHFDSQVPDWHQAVAFLPLYSSLPYNMQTKVFQPPSDRQALRRIVFSTNLAETSVTVPRITHVIDAGFVKLPYFNPKTGFDRLMVVPISRASAQQRAGRAGRLQPGQCYRLYTEKTFLNDMQPATPPEIWRANMSGLILTLKALGVDNILSFDLLDPPPVDSLSHGLESLYALGAIDDQTNLTPLGLDMSAFPTEPRVSRMLLESLTEKCSHEVAGIAAALQVRSIFNSLRGGGSRHSEQHKRDYEAAMSQIADPSGDHVSYVNALEVWDEQRLDREECRERFFDYVALKRVSEIRNQLCRFLKKHGRVQSLGSATQEERSRTILRCVTAGFFFHVAKLNNDGKYYTIRNKNSKILVTPNALSIFQTHGKFSEYIIFGETYDGARGGIELRSVSGIDPRWLRDLAPHYWE